MKVKCKDVNPKYCGVTVSLTKDKIYDICKESPLTYQIENDTGYIDWYDKSRFTPIKEEVMKIKNWKETDTRVINGFIFDVGALWVKIRLFPSRTHVITLWFEGMSDEVMIEYLKLLGIEVELEKEITITQNDYNLLKSLNISGNLILVKKYPEFGIRINGLEIPFSQHLFSTLEVDTPYLVSDLLKTKVEG